MPRPINFLIRIVAAGAIVLWLSHSVGRHLVAALIPICRDVMQVMQNNFRVLSVDIAAQGANEVLRFRANLAYPIAVGNQIAYPIDGWFEVTLTLGGVLGYGLLTCIAVLAWPIARAKEIVMRLVVALPLAVAVSIVNVLSTWNAELWLPLQRQFDPHIVAPLLIWSRFLMGGGGYLIGILCAVVAIACGMRLAAPRKIKQNRYAQFVMSPKANINES